MHSVHAVAETRGTVRQLQSDLRISKAIAIDRWRRRSSGRNCMLQCCDSCETHSVAPLYYVPSQTELLRAAELCGQLSNLVFGILVVMENPGKSRCIRSGSSASFLTNGKPSCCAINLDCNIRMIEMYVWHLYRCE